MGTVCIKSCARIESGHILETTEKHILTHKTQWRIQCELGGKHASMQHFLTRQTMAVLEGIVACHTKAEKPEELFIEDKIW